MSRGYHSNHLNPSIELDRERNLVLRGYLAGREFVIARQHVSRRHVNSVIQSPVQMVTRNEIRLCQSDYSFQLNWTFATGLILEYASIEREFSARPTELVSLVGTANSKKFEPYRDRERRAGKASSVRRFVKSPPKKGASHSHVIQFFRLYDPQRGHHRMNSIGNIAWSKVSIMLLDHARVTVPKLSRYNC